MSFCLVINFHFKYIECTIFDYQVPGRVHTDNTFNKTFVLAVRSIFLNLIKIDFSNIYGLTLIQVARQSHSLLLRLLCFFFLSAFRIVVRVRIIWVWHHGIDFLLEISVVDRITSNTKLLDFYRLGLPNIKFVLLYYIIELGVCSFKHDLDLVSISVLLLNLWVLLLGFSEHIIHVGWDALHETFAVCLLLFNWLWLFGRGRRG